ncbi:hypothetical protein [Micromonospora sp. DT62]|uniref:hypothetical protein n=1 Tax=Micromonospora sp. DT62 TaxID=3416521 RepID=UPI003CF80C4A
MADTADQRARIAAELLNRDADRRDRERAEQEQRRESRERTRQFEGNEHGSR